METESARNDHSSVVARIIREDTCVGSGFLIRPDLVLTCFHVTDRDPDKPLRVCFYGGDILEGVVQDESEDYDLALIRILAQKAPPPVSFLIGLRTYHENVLGRLDWKALGYNDRHSEAFLSVASVCREPAFQWDNKTGTLLDVQVNLGLASGLSGGPVLIETQGRTLCIGIVTLGGEDRDKSRIRLADCIVGFLEKSGLEVESHDACEVLPVSTALARPRANSNDGRMRNRLWRWIGTTGLLAAAAFAGLYLFLESASKVKPGVVPFKAEQSIPALPFYKVRIMLYSSATPPQVRIDKNPATLEAYDGRTATVRVHPGNHHVEADYDDRICTANVSVAGNLSTEAECHLK